MRETINRVQRATELLLSGSGLMALIAQLAAAFRELVGPPYHPELYYMRGPGPAYARRAVMVEARRVLPALRSERR